MKPVSSNNATKASFSRAPFLFAATSSSASVRWPRRPLRELVFPAFGTSIPDPATDTTHGRDDMSRRSSVGSPAPPVDTSTGRWNNRPSPVHPQEFSATASSVGHSTVAWRQGAFWLSRRLSLLSRKPFSNDRPTNGKLGVAAPLRAHPVLAETSDPPKDDGFPAVEQLFLVCPVCLVLLSCTIIRTTSSLFQHQHGTQ